MPRTPSLYHAAFDAKAATAWTAAAIGTFYLTQGVLFSLNVLELVISVVSDVVVIALLWRPAKKRGGWAAVGLRRVEPRFIAAAVLLGISMWYPALVLVAWVNPPGDVEPISRLVEQDALLPTLGAIAFAPAIAEEIVFRGMFARGLATRFTWPAALVFSSLVFSAFHLLPPQMLGTFPLGLALGYLALRSDSILPSMIMHAINNTIAILVSRNELPNSVVGWIAANEIPCLAFAFIIAGCGVTLAWRRA